MDGHIATPARRTPLVIRNALGRIKEQFRDKYDFVVVLEAIKVKEVYRVAVEVAAGIQLFHLVVNDDDVAEDILQGIMCVGWIS